MDNSNQNIIKKNNKTSAIVGISGFVILILSLFLPYVKSYKHSKSLVGIAKIYATSDSSMWHDSDYEKFYKIFVPAMVAIIVLFALVYLRKCIKQKPFGMIVSTIITIASYELLKYDFKDRRIVPGAFDKGIAYTVIYVAFAVMIAGIVICIVEKNKKRT